MIRNCLVCLFALLSSVALAQKNPPPHNPPYPPAWWAHVDPAGAPDWEVLPQAAEYGEVILSKRTELGIFSNLAATPVEFKGKKYASVEGFWQAAKYPENEKDPRAKFPGLEWKYTRAQVEQMSGFESKDAGNLQTPNIKKMGIDWVSFEGRQMPYHSPGNTDWYKLILQVMRAKMDQNPEVRRLLKATGDLKLRPDHDPGDLSLKAWQYYQVWMEFREEL
jgi:predicted NAD-dependent protein-ADP-ribosyltransferase YbiA (DUF1768 family)